jgi:hypothetical protein
MFTRQQVKIYLLILVSNLLWVMIDYSLTARFAPVPAWEVTKS